MPVRLVVAAALAVVCHGALAQAVTPAVSPVLTVQQLAPQLLPFAGSRFNFESLVNGLAQGTPVQLISVLPSGLTQTVTFTPTGTLSATQIAQVLESTRQQLIGLGIATPTPEQLGTALVGGTVPTTLGGSQVAGTLNPRTPSPAAQIQGNASAAAGASSPARLSVQTTPSTIPGNVSNSPVSGNVSDSPLAPGTTSRSQVLGVSNSPQATPTPLPGAGSSPPAAMRAPAAGSRGR